MEPSDLLIQLAGGGVAGAFITGAVKNRADVPREFRPLIALVAGGATGVGLGFIGGISITEVITGVIAGIIAVGGRSQILALMKVIQLHGLIQGVGRIRYVGSAWKQR